MEKQWPNYDDSQKNDKNGNFYYPINNLEDFSEIPKEPSEKIFQDIKEESEDFLTYLEDEFWDSDK